MTTKDYSAAAGKLNSFIFESKWHRFTNLSDPPNRYNGLIKQGDVTTVKHPVKGHWYCVLKSNNSIKVGWTREYSDFYFTKPRRHELYTRNIASGLIYERLF